MTSLNDENHNVTPLHPTPTASRTPVPSQGPFYLRTLRPEHGVGLDSTPPHIRIPVPGDPFLLLQPKDHLKVLLKDETVFVVFVSFSETPDSSPLLPGSTSENPTSDYVSRRVLVSSTEERQVDTRGSVDSQKEMTPPFNP